MRRIHDFYRRPPHVGQTIVMCPVSDDGQGNTDWAWFALDEGEQTPSDADDRYTQVYDGHHARELAK